MYQSHESVYWARTTGFVAFVYLITWCLIHDQMRMLMTQFLMHAFRFGFIDTCVLIYARHLALILPLIGEFLSPMDLHFQILEFGLWWTSCCSERVAVAPWVSGWSVRGPIFLGPPARLSSFPVVTREHLLYCLSCISPCILYFAPLGDLIFM